MSIVYYSIKASVKLFFNSGCSEKWVWMVATMLWCRPEPDISLPKSPPPHQPPLMPIRPLLQILPSKIFVKVMLMREDEITKTQMSLKNKFGINF